MTEKRFTIRKSGNGLFYSDGDYSIDNTTQFIIETAEFKLNELYEENKQLKKENHRLKEGMLFFIHIASAKLEDRDTYCEMVFNCNYAEAKKEYGTIIKRLLEE